MGILWQCSLNFYLNCFNLLFLSKIPYMNCCIKIKKNRRLKGLFSLVLFAI